MRYRSLLMNIGISMTVIFGGGFLIRYVRDADFEMISFIGGLVGLIIIFVSLGIKHNNKEMDEK